MTETIIAPDYDPDNDHAEATINVGGDVLRVGLTKLVEECQITKEESELIWWYFSFCKDSGFSLRRAGAEIGVDAATISKMFRCVYGAKLSNVSTKIARYKKIYDVRRNLNDMPFVETSIAKKVFAVCQAAWTTQSMAMIWGESQTGKTFALLEYMRQNNHGTTKYIRLPARAGIQLVLKEIAAACYVSAYASFDGMYSRVLKAVDHTNLLIFDEVHEAFISYLKGSAVSILELIREIHDRTRCGVVLCMTNLGRDEILTGKMANVLKQCRKRGTIKMQLPDLAPLTDFNLVAEKAFKLGKPDNEILEVIKSIRQHDGIGVYCHYLKMGARLAANQKAEFAWEHFLTAYNTIQKLSDGGQS